MNANFTVANATRLYDMLNLSDYADYRNAQSGPDDRQFFKSGNEVRYIFSGGKYDETTLLRIAYCRNGIGSVRFIVRLSHRIIRSR